MPKFHEIYAKTPMPFKVRCHNGETATCDGNRMTWDASGALVSAVSAATYEWELVTEPTVESVLREYGYECEPNPYGEGESVIRCRNKTKRPLLYLPTAKVPVTPERAAELCKELDRCK